MTRSERRRRTVLIAVRLLPAEHELLQQAAAVDGVRVSQLVRVAALADAATLVEHSEQEPT